MYNERKLSLDQQLLLPCDLLEWLPEDSLAYAIRDIISTLDLSTFYLKYRKDGLGGKFLDPSIKLSILIYAYCNETFSTRKMEEKIHYDIGFRVLARNRPIDHSTLARFRQDFKEPIKDIFQNVLKILKDAGAVNAGKIALDGSKIKANASLEKTKKYSAIRNEIDKILVESARIDEEEDEIFGEENGYEELPAPLKIRSERLELLNKLKEEIEEEQRKKAKEQEEKIKSREDDEKLNGKRRGRKHKPPKYEANDAEKRNTTDPDSRILKSRHGYIQGYNGQVVASEDQYIIDENLLNDQNDLKQLKPMLYSAIENIRNIEENEGVLSRTLLADAGYWVCKDIVSLGTSGVEILVSPRSEQKFSEVYDYSRMLLNMDDLCRPGTIPPCRAIIQETASWVSRNFCKFGEKITGSKAILKQVMGKKVAESSRKVYSRRKVIVEPVFAQIKTNMGFDKFSMRGIDRCKGEWSLICTAYNIKKGWKNGLFSSLRNKVKSIIENSTQKISPC